MTQTIKVTDLPNAGVLSGAERVPIVQGGATKQATTQQIANLFVGPGSGTVTSVGLSAPAMFSVTGSPVTTSGTLALALADQSANRVLAGPSSGAAAAPSFRALVSDDLPVAAVPKGGTGLSSLTAYALLAGGTTSTGNVQQVSGTGSSGQILVSGGTGVLPSWQTASSAVGQALTKADDPNVTLTLGGSPTSALLAATSITAGWTGQLSIARGGTGQATATAGFDALATVTSTAFGRSALTVANAAALATLAGVGAGDSPQFTAINLGHASNTTLTQAAAGVAAVEGNRIELSIDTRAALLTATIPASVNYVTVHGYASVGDGGSITYKRVGSSNQFVATSADGAYWQPIPINGEIDCRVFNAKGDNSTDDKAAIQRACDFMGFLGGGVAKLVPTGAAYRTTDSIVLGNGVELVGAGAGNFPGATATVAQWATDGSWLRCEHSSNPGVKLQGHGSGIRGINFIYDHPIPSGSWTPTVYGYSISVINVHSVVESICIVNGYNGIEFAYNSASGGGTHVKMRDVIVSAFNIRLRTSNVNDTMYWSNIHCRNLWYSSDPLVVAHLRANTIGWYCGYTDNIIVDGLEFFEEAVSLKFIDETCLGNTHSLYNATLNNVQFNLPEQSMQVASTTTTVRGYFGIVVAQQGNAFGYTWGDLMFDLASDNVDLTFAQLRIPDTGGQIMSLGNGSGGKCRIESLQVENYSTVSAGQVGFSVASNAILSLGTYRIKKPVGAGVRFAGGGLGLVSTDNDDARVLYSTFNQVDRTSSSSSTWIDLSTDWLLRPGTIGAHQIRLIGEVYVFTAAVGGTIDLRLSTLSDITVTGIDASTTGWKNVDTGWVDISQTSMDSLTTYGRLQALVTNTVRIQTGSLQFMIR